MPDYGDENTIWVPADPNDIYAVPQDERLDHDEPDDDDNHAGFTDLSSVDPDAGEVRFMDE